MAGAFKRSLRLLVVLGVLTALAKPKHGKGKQSNGGDESDPSNPHRPHGKNGQSKSTGEIQQTAEDNANNLDPDTSTSGNDPDPSRPDDDTDPLDGLPRDSEGRPIVDRDDKDGVRALYAQRNEDGSWPPDRELPKGWGVRKDDILYDEHGWPVRDPDKPYTSDRDKYFPSSFSKTAHEEMVRRYTVEGGQPDGTTGTFEAGRPKPDSPEIRYEVQDGIPVDAVTGEPVPRDRLTWFDGDGNEMDYYRTNSKGETVTNVTYDHKTPVVKYWKDEGYRESWTERAKWYNDADNLVPMPSKENSSKAGDTGDGQQHRYKDQPPLGPPKGNYTPKGTK